jgi:hypothetical protein
MMKQRERRGGSEAEKEKKGGVGGEYKEGEE